MSETETELTRVWRMVDGLQEQIADLQTRMIALEAKSHAHEPALYGAHYTHDVQGRRLPEPVPRVRHETGNGDR